MINFDEVYSWLNRPGYALIEHLIKLVEHLFILLWRDIFQESGIDFHETMVRCLSLLINNLFILSYQKYDLFVENIIAS